MIETLKNRLAEFLTTASGEPSTVERVSPLAGGASRDSWLIDATIGGEAQKMVLRRDLAAAMHANALTRAQEFHFIETAYQNGVLAPRPRYLCTDTSVLEQAFFLMDYVEGISIGRKVIQASELVEARKKLPYQMAEQLARIHAIDPQLHRLDFLPRPQEGYSPAQSAVIDAREALEALGVQNPAFEFGLRWCEEHTPACDQVMLLHGDLRIGNVLVGMEGLTAVIDWEFGHLGDPLQELGYPCMRDWRFGNGHLHFGGVSDRETFLQAYEQASGRPVDRAAVDWWEIMGNLYWGVTCLTQANRHLSGSDISVELASLGRRSAEMQLEMLRLIQKSGL